MQLIAFGITLQVPDHVDADEVEALVAAAVAASLVEVCACATEAEKLDAGYQVEREREVQH